MSDRTPRERFTGAIATILHHSYAEGLSLGEGNSLRDSAATAKALYAAERAARETAERGLDQLSRAIEAERQRVVGLIKERDATIARAETAERERDTLRREHALLRAECAAGREARDHARPPVMSSNVTVEEYGRRAKAWADEGVRLLNLHDAARAATDAAGVAVTGDVGNEK